MSTRIREWANLIAITGSAQVAVQVIGFISGILVIRLLPVHEYALYTLANTMLGTMSILADGGIATGVMAQGGKVWQDKSKLGAVLATGMALRKKFAVFSLLVAVPILFYLLHKHEASWLMSMLIALSLVPAFFSSLSGKLLEILPKLHQDIRPLQHYQVEANLGRLALLGLTMFVFPFAAVAILCAGASQLWNNWRLRRGSVGYADRTQVVDPAAKKAILGVVRRAMPGAIYYTISGQLSVWLLSMFGTSQNVAQIGALGRLTAILTLVGTIFGTLVIPRYARFSGHSKILIKRYLWIHTAFLLVSASVFFPFWAVPDVALGILGTQYMGLADELTLTVGASLLSTISGATYAMNASRGHIWTPKIFYPIIFTIQAVSVTFLPIDTVKGVILVSVATNLTAYLLNFGYGALHVGSGRGRVAA